MSTDRVCPGAALPTDEAEPLDICVSCARYAAFAKAHETGGAVLGVVPAAVVVVDGEARCANRRPLEG